MECHWDYHHDNDRRSTEGLLQEQQKRGFRNQLKKAQKKVLERLGAVRFMNSVDRARYQELSTNIKKEFLKGNEQYLKDITGAYNMLTNW